MNLGEDFEEPACMQCQGKPAHECFWQMQRGDGSGVDYSLKGVFCSVHEQIAAAKMAALE